MTPVIVENTQESLKGRILAFLETAEFGQTTAKIARAIGCARATVGKYLNDLVVERKVINREIGSYKVFEILKEEGVNKRLIDDCYNTLLAMLGQQYAIQPWPDFENILKKTGSIVGRNLIKIYSKKFDYDLRWEDLDVNHLHKLGELLPEILNVLQISDNCLKLEVTPPIKNIQPVSISVKVVDPKIFSLQAEFHYFIIAGIIEEFFTTITRVPIAFNIRQINAREYTIVFELGYLDKLFMDFSLISNHDVAQSQRDLLDRVKMFWNTYYDFRIEEYETNGTLHYRFTFPNNRIVEQKLTLNMANWRFFLNNYSKYLIGAPNQKLNDEKQTTHSNTNSIPFIVFKVETNAKEFWDSYITLSNQFYEILKCNFRFEKFDNHYSASFGSLEEFEMILTPRHEPKKEKQFLESHVGALSMQYYEIRNQIIGKIAEIYTRKR